jgi:hypothetical protein
VVTRVASFFDLDYFVIQISLVDNTTDTSNSTIPSNNTTTSNTIENKKDTPPYLYVIIGVGCMVLIGGVIAGVVFYKRKKAANATPGGSA